MSEKLCLFGSELNIALWRKLFGASVDYVITRPLDTAIADGQTTEESQ